MNLAAEKLTAWTAADAQGQPLDQVLRIVDGRSRTRLDNIALNPPDQDSSIRSATNGVLIAKDGNELPIDERGTLMRSDDGQLRGAVITFRDVTESRRQAQELEASELQFRTLAESIPQLAWMANPDGHVFWYNRRWFEYTGSQPSEVEGSGWQNLIAPPSRPAVPGTLERVTAHRRAVRHGVPIAGTRRRFSLVFDADGAGA